MLTKQFNSQQEFNGTEPGTAEPDGGEERGQGWALPALGVSEEAIMTPGKSRVKR